MSNCRTRRKDNIKGKKTKFRNKGNQNFKKIVHVNFTTSLQSVKFLERKAILNKMFSEFRKCKRKKRKQGVRTRI